MSRPQKSLSRASSGSTRRYTSAGGDSTVRASLEDELESVLKKEYGEGEQGKMDALEDVKSVVKEVGEEPLAQLMDKVLPRFHSQSQIGEVNSGESGAEEVGTLSRQQTTIHRSRSKNATPRHAKLTARPGKSHQGRGQLTGETASVPNIPPRTDFEETTRPATSAPLLPDETRLSSAVSLKSQTTKSLTEDEEESAESFPHPVESSLSSISRSGDALDTEDVLGDEEELPFTENLLQVKKDAEFPDEIWKSDIVQLTKVKSSPKGSRISSDVLELKYKVPEWPHQPFLNQILVKRPQLTHLILDGSELQFLRDLGSCLQSLITLSICRCNLRSLDGAYSMPNLRTLVARQNLIRIPTQCSFLTRLNYLDLSSNPIQTIDEFGALIQCSELRILKLHDTPVAAFHPNFNAEMKRLVPQLREIHPSQYDIVQELKQIRKQGHQAETREESKEQAENTVMPSLAYDHVMLDSPKSGIAYQKVEKVRIESASEIEDVRQVYMAPNFLQHLEEAMPPPTAEIEKELEQLLADRQHDSTNFLPPAAESTAIKSQHEICQAENSAYDQSNECSNKEKSDPVNCSASTYKNHPGGDAC